MSLFKRIAFFVVLLTGGFAGLFWATDGILLADGEKIPGREQPGDTSEPYHVPSAGSTQQAGKGLKINLEGGKVDWRSTEEVRLADGTRHEVLLYRFIAEKSQRLRDGRHECRDVTVVFYESGRAPSKRSIEAGTLTAKRAWIELGANARGQRSIATDKDIELEEAVLRTGADARVRNLTIEIARAIVKVTDETVHLRTQAPNQPFDLRIEDRGLLTLTGRGLDARFPASGANKPGGEPRDGKTDGAGGEDPGKIEIEVSFDPELVQTGAKGTSRLNAAGPLTYVEDSTTGHALISATGNVRVSGLVGGAGDTIVAFGDQLDATLQRNKSKPGAEARGSTAHWAAVRLTGENAGLRGRGMVLTCKALDLAPNLSGAPYLVTADGSPVLVMKREGRTMRFTAAERIHLVELQKHWQPLLAGRGFPAASFPAQVRQLLIFRGTSSVTVPRGDGELTLNADGGIRVLGELWSAGSSNAQSAGGSDVAMSTRGLGTVHVATKGSADRLDIRGNDGFLMHGNASGQTIFLGPRDPDPNHVFSLETGELTASGSGACRMFQPHEAGDPGEIHLRAPKGDHATEGRGQLLAFSMRGTGGSLTQVEELTASFRAEGIDAFEALGPRCTLVWVSEPTATQPGDRIEGTAVRIWSDEPQSYRLAGTDAQPAVVVSERGGTMRGGLIRVVQLSADATALWADGAAHLRVDKPPSDAKNEAAGKKGARSKAAEQFLEVDVKADSIAILPFLVAKPWLAPHLDLLPAVPGRTLLRPHVSGLAERHLVARGSVEVAQFDEQRKRLGTAHGDLLVLRQQDGRAVGRLIGAPARIVRPDKSGQVITGKAPVILIRRDTAGEHLSMLPDGPVLPRFIVTNRRDALAGFGSPDGSTEIVCHGPIRAAPERIDFDGSVDAKSLYADGSVQPDGFQLAAEGMHMDRDPKTGAVQWVHATEGADLRWRRLRAKATKLDLDLANETCHVTDERGRAWISLPNSFVGWCTRARFNLRTYEAAVLGALMAEDRPGKDRASR